MTIWVAMPAYNEAPRLPALLGRWTKVLADPAQPHRYVVVDDGSADETPQILNEFAATQPLHIITHAMNQGLGASLRDALRFVAEHANDEDVLVTMDADNTHPPELLGEMLARLEGANCDVVIASRFAAGARMEGVSLFRRLMSIGARMLFQIVFPIRGVRDYTCGFRLYRVGVIKQAFDRLGKRFCDRPGFDCTADILLRLAKLGATFREIPLLLQYASKRTESRMRVAHTVISTLTLMLKRRIEHVSAPPLSQKGTDLFVGG